ncbi:MAG: alpha/beta hydrolase, partial [Saprospiraceae bacterium]
MNKFDHISGTQFLTGDAKIYYEKTGSLDKPILLLLHGGFGNIEDFNTILPQIKNDFYVIGVDSRGHGKSTLGERDLSYELIQNDIEQLLNHLGIHKLSIIGFSDGGIVAYRLASYSDLKINKLITIGSRWHHKNILETKEILSSVTAEKWRLRFPEMVNSYERNNPEPNFDRLSTQLVQMWLNEKSYPDEDVKNIKASTLIVRGDKDHLVKRKFVFDIAELIENSSLSNIAFAGHAVHMEDPEVLLLT